MRLRAKILDREIEVQGCEDFVIEMFTGFVTEIKENFRLWEIEVAHRKERARMRASVESELRREESRILGKLELVRNQIARL